MLLPCRLNACISWLAVHCPDDALKCFHSIPVNKRDSIHSKPLLRRFPKEMAALLLESRTPEDTQSLLPPEKMPPAYKLVSKVR